jgi:TetR/AcrR family transcriptional regulator, transcriptional repressor for nem operon
MIIMARYPAEHKETTRARILAASERLLKRDGVERASVEAVMREAGLTVGGFYAHFESKDDLARQALLYSVEESFARLTRGLDDLDDRAFVRALISRYLAQAADPNLEHACPLTVLLPEVARSPSAFRDEFATRTAALLRAVEHRFPERRGFSQRETALAVFAALSGAVAMARAAATPSARAKIAGAAEAFLVAALALDGPPAHQAPLRRRPLRSRRAA